MAADADGVMRRKPDGTWINLSSPPLVLGQGMPEQKKGPYWATLDVKPIGSGPDVRVVAASVDNKGAPSVVWTEYNPSQATTQWTGIPSNVGELRHRVWWSHLVGGKIRQNRDDSGQRLGTWNDLDRGHGRRDIPH